MKTGNPRDPIRNWRVLSTELVLDNEWAKVRRDACELPNGVVIPNYFYWEGNDFSQVFAITSEGNVVLTRQYKHAVNEIVVELPAGLVSPGETPAETAERELREETGYVGTDWTGLGQLNVSSAKATTRANAFLLTSAEKRHSPTLDSNEQIDVFTVSVDELLQKISQGEIRDVNSVATTLLALRALHRM